MGCASAEVSSILARAAELPLPGCVGDCCGSCGCDGDVVIVIVMVIVIAIVMVVAVVIKIAT